jgi:Ca2+-binding RTX toxin-like protein
MAARKWGIERTIGDYDSFGGGNNKEWDVAALDGGGYVVTWIDRTTPLLTARGQRFDGAGTAVGNVFEIGASLTGSHKGDIVVTGVDGGGFVVAFTHGANSGDSWCERYNASGVVQSTFLIDGDAETEGNMAIVRTAGGFRVVETDQFEDGVNSDGIWSIGYDLNDSPTTGFALVNGDAVTGLQTDPAIAALTSGGTVVSWVDYNDQTIKFRLLDSSGVPATASIVVDDDPFASGVPEVPPQVVGLANGGFLIVWHESLEPDSADQSGYAVRGMIYSAAGTPQSGVLLINTLRTGDQTSPDIIALPDGGFFASWTSLPSGIDADIKGLQFDVGGIRVGAEITINTTATGIDIDPHMTLLSDGRIAVVWNELNTGTLRSQIIDPRDGLVSGTASAETLYGNDLFNDDMNGLAGADVMYGLAGADIMLGGAGADTLYGGRGDDTVYGGADGDIVYGDLGDDELFGGDGNDVIYSYGGADLMDGGAGTGDSVFYVNERSAVTVNLVDQIQNAGAAFGDTIVNIERVYGVVYFANILTGDNNSNILVGGIQADILNGGGGFDVLRGGLGADTMSGGTSGDYFQYTAVAEGGDTITAWESADKFTFSRTAFGNLAGANVAAANFLSVASGHAALNASQKFIFDQATDQLWYDADGSAGGAAVFIADITTNYNILNTDLLLA